MALAARERRAGGDVVLPVFAVPVGGLAVFERRLEAGVVLVQDEVDHPADGVRAVGGRRPAGHDLDPLDQRLREGVGVDLPGRGRNHRALPVEQDQRPAGSERPKVERADPGGAVAERARRIGRRDRAGHRGQRVDEICDIGRGRCGDFLRPQDVDRRRRVKAVAGDARAGHHHLLQIGASCGFVSQGRGRAAQERHDADRGQRATARIRRQLDAFRKLHHHPLG